MVTSREAALSAIRTIIIPDGEPDGILFRSTVIVRIEVASIVVASIVVVNGHSGYLL